jgi:hypothetical protein
LEKITAGISAIRRVKPFVDKDTLVSIYKCHCSPIDLNANEKQSKRLQKLQNRTARVIIIMDLNNDINHSIGLRALGWEPLKTKRKKQARARMMYKVLNKIGPKSLANHSSYKSEKTNCNLREISSALSSPNPRTNNSFMYNGAWNTIPKEIMESKTLSSFRNIIAAHIIDI